VHDVVRLEKRGLPAVNVGTEVFLDEGLEQARVLGMADYRMVWLPHPVATQSTEEIQALAREHASAIVARLTGRE
jgi:hypothetical protein